MFTDVEWRNADGGNIPLGKRSPLDHYKKCGANINWHEWLDESPDLALVPANPDDEAAAEEYADKHDDPYLSIAFLAGCAHKAQELAKYGDMASALSKAGEELEQLRAWKKEAMRVMPDFQEIGSIIGVPIGQYVHDKIVPALRSMYTRQQMEDCWEASRKYNCVDQPGNPDRDTFINSLKP